MSDEGSVGVGWLRRRVATTRGSGGLPPVVWAGFATKNDMVS